MEGYSRKVQKKHYDVQDGTRQRPLRCWDSSAPYLTRLLRQRGARFLRFRPPNRMLKMACVNREVHLISELRHLTKYALQRRL